MKVIKILGVSLVVLLVVLLVVSFFLPSSVSVSRSLAMQAAPERVFEQINTLTNWEAWSPWHKLDPNMKLTYEGPVSGVGAKYNWESTQRNVGSGSLTITESASPHRVRTAMDFRDQGQAVGAFELVAKDNATEVTWSMQSDLGRNPLMRYFGLLMDRMIGADFERGLQNLKGVSETKSP